jgi:hypothetical protein
MMCFPHGSQEESKYAGVPRYFSTGGHEIVSSFAPEIIRVYPMKIIGWGIDSDVYQAQSRTVE